MVAKYQMDVQIPPDTLIYETLPCPVKYIKIDILPPVKEISKMKNGFNTSFVQIGEKHFPVELLKVLHENQGVLSGTKMGICYYCGSCV